MDCAAAFTFRPTATKTSSRAVPDDAPALQTFTDDTTLEFVRVLTDFPDKIVQRYGCSVPSSFGRLFLFGSLPDGWLGVDTRRRD